MAKCVPFIRVPDIGEAIKWYEAIGFKCTGTNHTWEPECELNWAELYFHGATFMLYPQELEKPKRIRDAGLYFEMETIDGLAEKLRGIVKDIEETDMTFYGRKEIGFEDLNGYSITFSCLPNNS